MGRDSLDGQDVTRGRLGRFLERVAVCWGHLAHMAGWRSPREGQRLLLDAELALKRANVSLKGLDVSFLAHLWHFLAFNVKTVISILKVSLVGCFNDLFLIKGHRMI
jgi:hypothetical protein